MPTKTTTKVEKITEAQKDMLMDVCARMAVKDGFDSRAIEKMLGEFGRIIDVANEAIVHQQLADKLSK